MSKIYRVEENIVDFYKNIDAVSMHGSTDTQSATFTAHQHNRPTTATTSNAAKHQPAATTGQRREGEGASAVGCRRPPATASLHAKWLYCHSNCVQWYSTGLHKVQKLQK